MVFGLSFMSLSGGFTKLNLLFPPVMAATAAIVKWWMTSPLADASLTFLSSKGVPTASVPCLVAVCMPAMAFLVNLPVIMGLAAMDPGGYDNTMPRQAQTPDKLAKGFPTLFRLKSAHNNTLECLAMMAPAFWAAQTLKLDELVFAKLSVLFLLARTVYVFCCKAASLKLYHACLCCKPKT